MPSCKLIHPKKEMMWVSVEKTKLPATAYGMLAVAAVWSFLLHILTLHVLSLGHLSFGLFFFTGLFGVWHYVFLYKNSETSRITTFFKIIKFVTDMYSLPIILSDLYMKYNFSNELIVAHLFLPILALVPYGTNTPADKTLLYFKKYYPQNRVKDTMEFVIFCSVVSLAMVSILGSNLFGLAAAFVYAGTYFIVTEEGYVEWLRMPAEPIYISGMGVFCLLGMRAMMTN